MATRDGLIDVRARLGDRFSSVRDVLAAGAVAEVARAAAGAAPDLSLDAITYLPPIIDPAKIIGIGLNYKTHVAEIGRAETENPSIFLRYADTVVGHETPLIKPRVSSHFDYEGELGVVIGKPAFRVAEEDALSYVAGYTCFNDGSLRDYQRHTSQWTPGKNHPSTGAFGPWLVTADEIPDPTQLTLVTRVNGHEVQRATTDLLIYSIPVIVAYVTSFTPLAPGDVIATGTPGGVGSRRTPPVWLAHGDVVEVDISGIGVLRNVVADEV